VNDDLLTIDEASKILKTHKSYIFRLMREGELPVVRRGPRYTRILKSDLLGFINRYREEGAPTRRLQDEGSTLCQGK
jgi:excisionase family DNA binding protein